MPGLVGCVSGQTLDHRLLKAMVKPMLHRPDYQVREHAEDHFMSSAIDLASDGQNGFIQSKDGRYALILFGAIYESWASSKGEILNYLLSRRTVCDPLDQRTVTSSRSTANIPQLHSVICYFGAYLMEVWTIVVIR